ncbi:MAG: alpha/beta hydrolase-fold protein [Eubacteriales bacterium]|nr:alpha/beta hydrolase-fold protein [Eubacteriales bacterium]
MKKLKKLVALVMTAAFLLGMTQTAFADTGAPILTGLSVLTAVQDGKNISFVPSVTDYTYNVQSDCYGVKITAMAPEGTVIAVNGEEIESGKSKIVAIDGSYPNYDIVLETPITVTASKNGMTTTYTVNVVRDCDTAVYNLFTPGEYVDAATGVVMPYELYVPTNYDPNKKYPIVFALHGSGQRTQSVDMVLKRYQMATVWAKDSEAGKNECIVLAPQCKVADANIENWTTLMAYRAGQAENAFAPMKYLDAAYNLLLKVMDEYSVDRSRVYMTGLSAGGFATYTLAIEHPEVFAAIAPDAAGADPAKVEALRGMPMWIFQAADDPTVKIVEYYNPTVEALRAAGIYYKSTLYAPGTVFGTSAHFSWVPMYANQEFRDWMFAQHK